MSFRFVLGGSGSGKSTELYNYIIKKAGENPRKNYLIIVPDQFTMEIQRSITNMHPGRCIMNIDVLSFSRLMYRVFEEMGEDKRLILDDTGKNLILAGIASRIGGELPVLGSQLEKPGYIHEVKALISEFMQYGIGDSEIDELISIARESKRNNMAGKLSDVKRLYEEFKATLSDKYATRETRMEVLADKLKECSLIKDAEVVFDGFTGFTPVQYPVLRVIMERASVTYFSFLWDNQVNSRRELSDIALFHLSSKAMETIRRLGEMCGCKEEKEWNITPAVNPRFENNPALARLESGLFRVGGAQQETAAINAGDCIKIYRALNPYEEVRTAVRIIRELTAGSGKTTGSGQIAGSGQTAGNHQTTGNYAYRDIAIVCGNLEGYLEPARRAFEEANIPVFMDVRHKFSDNPLADYIRSAIRLKEAGFSYEAVFTCVKNLFSDISGKEEADRLENYCLASGIRGYSRWSKPMFGYEFKDEDAVRKVAEVEPARAAFMDSIKPFCTKLGTMRDYCNALREFLKINDVEGKLGSLADSFKETDSSKYMEYSQIFTYLVEIIDTIEEFVGDSPTDANEFLQILDAAISEFTVGTIPQSVDRILVGDMERTRFSQIKVMIVLGVNEGSIPKTGMSGGILSVNDRQILEGRVELSPGPREMMYRQRLYLYMNLTQPTDRLYMTYSMSSMTGEELQPSYLIGMVQGLFADLTDREVEEYPRDRAFSVADAKALGTAYIRNWKESSSYRDVLKNQQETANDTDALQNYLAQLNAYIFLKKRFPREYERINAGAFFRYINTPLGRELSEAIYGTRLSGSISSFQQFFECPYKFYLGHGLKLSDREKLEFGYSDSGNMIHSMLEGIGRKLRDRGVSWEEAGDELIDELLAEVIESEIASSYQYKLEASGKNRFGLYSAGRIAARSVRVLSYHLKQGRFKPLDFEKHFNEYIELDNEKALTFRGAIDRIDVCESDDKRYYKVLDYKTGNAEIKLADIYNGLSLQLPMYMDEVLRSFGKLDEKSGREAVPAAMLLYKAKDPLIEPAKEASREAIETKRLEDLKAAGLINGDDKVLMLLDGKLDAGEGSVVENPTSDVISIGKKKAGTYTEDELKQIMNYSRSKIVEAGNRIYEGDIQVSPCKKGSGDNAKTGCDYCPYARICGIETGFEGYEYRKVDTDVKIEDFKCQ